MDSFIQDLGTISYQDSKSETRDLYSQQGGNIHDTSIVPIVQANKSYYIATKDGLRTELTYYDDVKTYKLFMA